MLTSCTYASAALEEARAGRWSTAHWLLERAARTAPLELLHEYAELTARARGLAAKQMLLMSRSVALA